jgi:hypothetical protein
VAKRKRWGQGGGGGGEPSPPHFPEGPRGFTLQWLHDGGSVGDRLAIVKRHLPTDFDRRADQIHRFVRSLAGAGGRPSRPIDPSLGGTMWHPLHWAWHGHPQHGLLGYLMDVIRQERLPVDSPRGVGDHRKVDIALDAIGGRRFPAPYAAPHILTAICPDGEFTRILATQIMGLVTFSVTGLRTPWPASPVALAVRGVLLNDGRMPETIAPEEAPRIILLLDPLTLLVDNGPVVRIDQAGRYLYERGDGRGPAQTLLRAYHPADEPWFSALTDEQRGYLFLWRNAVPGFVGKLGAFGRFLDGTDQPSAPASGPEPAGAVVPTHAVYAQALEQQMAVLHFLRQQHPFEKVARNVAALDRLDARGEERLAARGREMDDHVARAILNARPVFWTAEMLTVLEGLEPTLKTWTVQQRDFLHPNGFVWFERPLALAPGDPEVMVGYVWTLVTLSRALADAAPQGMDGPGYMVCPLSRYERDVPGFLANGNPWHGTPRLAMHFPIGQTLADHLEAIEEWVTRPGADRRSHVASGTTPELDYAQMTRWARLFAASIVLMNQRLTRLSDFRTDRAGRKRAQGVFPTPEPPLIKTVLLRRVDYVNRPEAEPGEGAGEPIAWSRRWLVSRHWREQWFPSEQRHKSIVIEAYVKGPPDKPLILPKDGELDLVGR